jgi:dTDP-4-dehydrorhamnose reductase
MRYLILGKSGMLGHDMEKTFHGEDYIALDIVDLDITDRDSVFETLMTIQPDVLINCAGYTNVDKAEEEEEKANEINGYAVGVLAKACREIDATLVHFSTDYVFDGTKKGGYNEDDAPSPINNYGRSKALGESLIFDEMDSLDQLNPVEGKYFIIRTSWLYGHHGANFVDTMLDLAKSKKELKVVDDQFGKPTYTVDLCEQVKWLVESREYPTGIYHITNEKKVSWYEFAKEIFKLAKKDVSVLPCATGEYPRPAKRPKYSSLNNNQLPKLRSWKEALKDYLK